MARAGSDTGEGRGGGKKADKLHFTERDLSSDEFKQAWLTLKEIHDKDLQQMHAKLTSACDEAEKESTKMTAYIEQLITEQYHLKSTIDVLRNKLKEKTCDRCLSSEGRESTMLEECTEEQQKNLKFIAKLSAEVSQLKEDNNRLSRNRKPSKQVFPLSLSDSDDDSIPHAQKPQENLAMKKIRHVHNWKNCSGSSVSGGGPDITDMIDKRHSDNMSIKKSSDNPKSLAQTVLDSDKQDCIQEITNLPEDKAGTLKKKRKTNTRMLFASKHAKNLFSSNLPSIFSKENAVTQTVSESSEESMPGNSKSTYVPGTKKRGMNSWNLYLVPSSKPGCDRRSGNGARCYNIEISPGSDIAKVPSSTYATSEDSSKSTYSRDGPGDGAGDGGAGNGGAGDGAEKPDSKITFWGLYQKGNSFYS